MTQHDDTQPNDATDDRLTNLEEKHSFSERTIEDLSGEIIALHDRLRAAMARLERLEQSLERLTWTLAAGPAPDPPTSAHESGHNRDDPPDA